MIAQPCPDLIVPGLISEPTHELHRDAAEDLERRIIMAHASDYVRLTSAIQRARARQVPASGDSGVKGSVDDPLFPPTLYEWMLLMLYDDAYRWEAITTVEPRCLFCNARLTDLNLHVEEVHAAKWRQAMLTKGDLRPQDAIGMCFYTVVISESWELPFTDEEGAIVRSLLEVYNHLSFVKSGGPFPILGDRYIPLIKLAHDWALGRPLTLR